ncbi:uncharacterized protein DUF3558 [Amycolatopsis sulphurea]|uniref:Uncharacterized protein DUF3558 n=1 Tax=Amycolatopsis sulphurea TaxID=76022 RepID=A0A2A9FE26_9PSEU|nr:uncharacterized protein DUF3558 [Amycolatopsis sulphurea]
MSQSAQGPGWLDGLAFTINDAFGAGGAAVCGGASGGGGSPGGPGFTMSRDDALSMLKLAKTVREHFDLMRPKAHRLTQITSPADEPGSNGYTKLLVNQGEPKGTFVTGKEQVDEEFAYADELVNRLEKALGITEASDGQASSDVNAAEPERGVRVMTRRTLTAVLGVAAVVSAAGCSGDPNAAPASSAPVSASSSAAAATLPHSGAPKVEHPLPASVLSGQPCQEALASDQLTQIFGTAPQGKPDTLPGIGPECRWANIDSGAGLSVGYTTQTHQGLSGVYQNTKPQSKVWRELPPIQAFPAVAASTFNAGTQTGFCGVSVGVADDLSFDVSLTPSDAKRAGGADPCELSARVADMVVTNLKRKAGA